MDPVNGARFGCRPPESVLSMAHWRRKMINPELDLLGKYLADYFFRIATIEIEIGRPSRIRSPGVPVSGCQIGKAPLQTSCRVHQVLYYREFTCNPLILGKMW